jgi:hypothetical protein
MSLHSSEQLSYPGSTQPEMRFDRQAAVQASPLTAELIQEARNYGIALEYFTDGLHEFTFTDVDGGISIFVNRPQAQLYVRYSNPLLEPEVIAFAETDSFSKVMFDLEDLSKRGTTISYAEFTTVLSPTIL